MHVLEEFFIGSHGQFPIVNTLTEKVRKSQFESKINKFHEKIVKKSLNYINYLNKLLGKRDFKRVKVEFFNFIVLPVRVVELLENLGDIGGTNEGLILIFIEHF